MIAFVAISVLLTGVPASPATSCLEAVAMATGCPSVGAENDGREVDLVGEFHGGGGGGAGGPGTGAGTVPDADQTPETPDAPAEPVEEPLRWDWTVDAPPEVTIEDLASFSPAPGVAAGEPAGWGIVGLETNFYATTAAHVVDGELLGEPASVRFTPVGWDWSYGDGATASLGTPGAAWGSATDEFQPTPSSHRYRTTGTFAVSLVVEFTAEFRFADGGWVGVPGTVRAEATPLSVRIGTADTLLVEHGCEADSGPGC